MKTLLIKLLLLIAFSTGTICLKAQTQCLAQTEKENICIGSFTCNNNNLLEHIITVSSDCSCQLKVRIFNSNGDFINEVEYLLTIGENKIVFNEEDLFNGIYFIQFYSEHGTALRRLSCSNYRAIY
jgi:hypothetical protein